MTKVCLFTLPSRYGVGEGFVDELASAFQEIGVEVALLDLLQDDFATQFALLLNDPPDFCLSLNALSAEFQVEGKGLHELCNSSLIGLYIDDPLIPSNTYRLSMQNHIATFPSPQLAKLVGERFSIPSIPLYHGVSKRLEEPLRERSIDLIFFGTYQSPDKLRKEWQSLYPSNVCEQIEALIELAKTEDKRPIWELFEARIPFEEVITSHAEAFIRHFRRDKLLEIAAKGGHAVTLVGEGWESSPHSAFHTLLGPCPYSDLIELVGQAKVALQVTPPFCAGSHERPLIAMERASAVLVDGSPFFEEHFNLPTYSWKAPEGILEGIDSALSNWEELGREGQDRVHSAHTWQHRALELLNVDCNV